MTKPLSAGAEYTLANEVTPMGRRLFQISHMKRGQRSYQLTDEFCAFTGSCRSIIDGELLRRGLVREKKHRDHTRSYVLTDKGRVVAAHIEKHITE